MHPKRAGHRFFLEKNSNLLSPSETHHLVKVLRVKEGEIIWVIDGEGKEYQARFVDLVKQGKELRALIQIEGLLRSEKPPEVKVCALIPVLKGDLTEFLVEKGTELGIQRFLPFISKHSVVKPKEKLWLKLKAKAISALKQSGRLIMPEICQVEKLENIVQNISNDALRLLAYREKGISPTKLFEHLKNESLREVYLVSGPEGGLAEQELTMLWEFGFQSLSLGPYILRAETASLVLMGFVTGMLLSLRSSL